MKLNKFNPIVAFFALTLTLTFIFSACGSDLFVDPAGTCVTCTYEATTTSPARVIQACADGDGNITVEEAGESPVTSERTLNDFRLPHESSGATCQ